MRVAFIAGFSPIVCDLSASHGFYQNALGLSFEGGQGDYKFTEKLGGAKHLGLWPLSEAARACFGKPEWPDELPVPQASLEFEVDGARDVSVSADQLKAEGYELLHAAKTEPWGQTIARLLSPEGLIIGICFTPEFHE